MLTCMFCIVGCKLFETPAKDAPQEKLFYEVVIDKADTTKNSAQRIAEGHLKHRKEIKEISDYKINSITITTDIEESIVFMCTYNMKPTDKYKDIDATNVDSTGWIQDRNNFFTCTVENDKITLKSITNSPPV